MAKDKKKKKKDKGDDSIFEIDKYRLDVEWQKQPKLFYEYSLKLAEAQRQADEAANALKAVEASVASAIRRDPGKFKLEKVTESAIKENVPLQPDYINAIERVNETKHAVGILVATVRALEHKKRALEKLVDLHGQNYFSEPRSEHAGETLKKQTMTKKK